MSCVGNDFDQGGTIKEVELEKPLYANLILF